MSYCHTCSGGMTNIALDFHEQVEATMLWFLTTEGQCLEDNPSVVGVDDFVTTLADEPRDIDALANDIMASCDADSVAIAVYTTPSDAGATVELIEGAGPDGRDVLRYTPIAGFSGQDTFTYKLFGSDTTLVTVDVVDLRQPDSAGPLEAGVEVAYYELSAPQSLPDYTALEPYAGGIVDMIDEPSTNGPFAGSGRADEVGAVYEGYLEAPADGIYTLFTESDDGSRLLIGGTTVVTNDGLHPMVEKQGSIGLATGLHAIRVEFFENGGGAGLIVRWESDAIEKAPIPATAWRHGDACAADLDGDGSVGVTDLVALITDWGLANVPADLDGSGNVDVNDLVALIVAWGPC